MKKIDIIVALPVTVAILALGVLLIFLLYSPAIAQSPAEQEINILYKDIYREDSPFGYTKLGYRVIDQELGNVCYALSAGVACLPLSTSIRTGK